MKKSFKAAAVLLALSLSVGAASATAPTEELDGIVTYADALIMLSPRASDQLDSYAISLKNLGNGTLELYYSVYGTHDKMSVIGAKTIVVEEEVSPGVWQEWHSYKGLYNYNDLYRVGIMEISVFPGSNYRAKLTAYGEDSHGSDTKTLTSVTVKAT